MQLTATDGVALIANIAKESNSSAVEISAKTIGVFSKVEGYSGNNPTIALRALNNNNKGNAILAHSKDIGIKAEIDFGTDQSIGVLSTVNNGTAGYFENAATASTTPTLKVKGNIGVEILAADGLGLHTVAQGAGSAATFENIVSTNAQPLVKLDNKGKGYSLAIGSTNTAPLYPALVINQDGDKAAAYFNSKHGNGVALELNTAVNTQNAALKVDNGLITLSKAVFSNPGGTNLANAVSITVDDSYIIVDAFQGGSYKLSTNVPDGAVVWIVNDPNVNSPAAVVRIENVKGGAIDIAPHRAKQFVHIKGIENGDPNWVAIQ